MTLIQILFKQSRKTENISTVVVLTLETLYIWYLVHNEHICLGTWHQTHQLNVVVQLLQEIDSLEEVKDHTCYPCISFHLLHLLTLIIDWIQYALQTLSTLQNNHCLVDLQSKVLKRIHRMIFYHLCLSQSLSSMQILTNTFTYFVYLRSSGLLPSL